MSFEPEPDDDFDPELDPAATPNFLYLSEYQALGPIEAPEVVVPRLALAGRVTLLAAEEKAGKSTLVGQGVAALSSGDAFLGKATLPGTALYMTLDEPTEDCVGRLLTYKANPEKVAIVQEKLPWNELHDVLDAVRPHLMVIDTLTEWAVTEIDDLNSAKSWTPLLKMLRTTCRSRGMGCILLHHTIKGGARYADSRAIGAGVDIILEMRRAHDDTNRRIVSFRGRGIGAGTFRIRYGSGRYELEESGWNK